MKTAIAVGASLSALALLAAAAARAELTDVNIETGIYYFQASAAPATISSFDAFNADADMESAGDFNGGTLTFPGPASPLALTPTTFKGPAVGALLTFSSQSALQTAIPFGTYAFTVTNSVTSATQSASIAYTVDAYTSDIPSLTAASYTGLQGVNANSAIDFAFNSFTPSPFATGAETVLSIVQGGEYIYQRVGLDSTTNILIPAGILLPGQTYEYLLQFTDEIDGTDPTSGVTADQISVVGTDGLFSTATAVPEPTSLMLFAAGLAALGRGRRRRTA